MKVECTNQEGWMFKKIFLRRLFFWQKKKNKPSNGPKKGDVVTVSREVWHEGILYYAFVEWPNSGFYNSKYFKPIEENSFEKVTYEQVIKKNPISVQ